MVLFQKPFSSGKTITKHQVSFFFFFRLFYFVILFLETSLSAGQDTVLVLSSLPYALGRWNGRGREDLLFAGSLSRCPQQPRVGQAEARKGQRTLSESAVWVAGGGPSLGASSSASRSWVRARGTEPRHPRQAQCHEVQRLLQSPAERGPVGLVLGSGFVFSSSAFKMSCSAKAEECGKT